MSSEPQAIVPVEEDPSDGRGSKALQMIGWFSIGMAVAALGIYLGAELRSRSKFNKRTPYDFYANAGEQQAASVTNKIRTRRPHMLSSDAGIGSP